MGVGEGVKILWIFLWGHHKIGLYFGVMSMHFRVSSLGQGTEWGIFFWVAKISKYFSFFFFGGGGGGLKFLIFFGVNGTAGPEPTHEENMRVPPTPLDTNPFP